MANIYEPIKHESLLMKGAELLDFTDITIKLTREVMYGYEDDTDLLVWPFQTGGSAALVMNSAARTKKGTVNQYCEEE